MFSFLPRSRGLRGAGFGRHHRPLDLPLRAGAAAAGAALLVHHLPEPVPHHFDVLLLHLRAQIAAHLRLVGHGDIPVLIARRLAVRRQHGLDQPRRVADAAIRHGGVGHGELQRRGQHVPLADGDVRRVGGAPFLLRDISPSSIPARA